MFMQSGDWTLGWDFVTFDSNLPIGMSDRIFGE
jgi:hypothetical protein